MEPGPVVLVTGTTSGIGQAAVRRLARAGCRVLAGARRPEAVEAAPGVVAVRLDVTRAEDRAAAVEEALRRHGRLDAVVNNAGWGAMLAMEDTDEAHLRRVFDTNVFGLHGLARLALPHMRRQGSGRIVNVASIAGHVPVPMMGAYCATKFAVRAMTQAMDMEVRRFGVRAVLVEPGIIQTGFGARSQVETGASVDSAASAYRAMYERLARSRTRRGGRSPDVIARCITHAVTSRRPRNHYLAPWRDAKLGNLAKRLLPDAWTMALLRAYFR